jgi:hypothetical protein
MSNQTKPYSYPPQEGVKKVVTPQKEFEKFPHGIHSKDGRVHRVAHSQEDLDQKLADGWLDYDPGMKAPEPAGCPNCARMKEKFDSALKALGDENDELQKAYDQLASNKAYDQLAAKKKNGKAKQPESLAA